MTLQSSPPRRAGCSLRARLYAIVGFLGLLPVLGAVAALIAVTGSTADNAAMDRAARGSIHLERINGLVYAVVMESRGIYMSPDWSVAKPFAKNLMQDLSALNTIARIWKVEAIASQQANIDELARRIDEFVRFRTELVRLAEEENTAAARVFGDNDANRKVRGALNEMLSTIAHAYEQEIGRARAKVESNDRRFMIALAGSAALACVALLIGIVQIQTGLLGPLSRVRQSMLRLARGEPEKDIDTRRRAAEIAEMIAAVQVFKDSMIETERLRAEQEVQQASKEARRQAVEAHIHSFEDSVSDVLRMVSAAATELEATAQSMSATAEEAERQSTAVAAASEEASTNVQTVASAAEELSSSIAEISRQVATSSDITARAVEDTRRTNEQIQGLAEAAQSIGDVVKLISDIASQTNLLALNATIEAARAGDAGKGFAVVASEVKSLASQTAKATEEISTKITEMQTATSHSVTAVQEIGQTIARINEIATTIASAVEEQGAATQEIARNVQQASAGTTEVSMNIVNVTRAANDTGAASTQVLGTAGELARQSEALRSQVERFLSDIRAA